MTIPKHLMSLQEPQPIIRSRPLTETAPQSSQEMQVERIQLHPWDLMMIILLMAVTRELGDDHIPTVSVELLTGYIRGSTFPIVGTDLFEPIYHLYDIIAVYIKYVVVVVADENTSVSHAAKLNAKQ